MAEQSVQKESDSKVFVVVWYEKWDAVTASYDRSKRKMSEKCTDKVAGWAQSVPNAGV